MKRLPLLQSLVNRANKRLHGWVDTDYKACRACGTAFFIFAVILVFPLPLNLIFGRSELRHASGILGLILLPAFGISLATAIMSFVVSRIMFSKAAILRKRPNPDALQRCGYAFLGLALVVLVPLFATMFVVNAQPLLPFRIPRGLMEPFKFFSRGAFLLYGGLIRWHFAGRVLFGFFIAVLTIFGIVIGAIAIELLTRSRGSKRAEGRENGP